MLLQPPLAQGDGPISLVMAPTRELVVQIGKDIRRFSKALALSVVCAYGGSAVAGQIADLKRGAEVRCFLHLSFALRLFIPSRYACLILLQNARRDAPDLLLLVHVLQMPQHSNLPGCGAI